MTGAVAPARGVLADKRILVTGVVTESSIASAVVRVALAEGAKVLLTAPMCRVHRMTSRMATRLGVSAPVLALDVEQPGDLDDLAGAIRDAGWDSVDGVVHAMAYAPETALGSDFASLPWQDAASTLKVSTWSLAALAHAARPLLRPGSSMVALDFDGTKAWAGYDWMGVAKAGLEATARYLARDLGPAGVRVNLVAAGPLRTLAARGLPGFERRSEEWHGRAPLGWDCADAGPVARAVVALMSDWFPATTGEIFHVDGGFHAVGG